MPSRWADRQLLRAQGHRCSTSLARTTSERLERRVNYRHALRVAITPIVTQFGIDVGTLLGGVVVTETVFGLPGLGQLAINSIDHQDLPTIIGLVLLASAFVVAANVLVDVAYAALDPRVRLS
jgi:peptide/nickel transport system permease protein